MIHVHEKLSVSISELKENPIALINAANGRVIAILNHKKTAAYIISPETYEWMLNALENFELLEIAKVRLKEQNKAIRVTLDDL